MNFNTDIVPKALALIAMTLVLTGCPPKKKPKIEEAQVPVTDTTKGQADASLSGQTPIEIGTEWVNVPNLQAVYFTFESADLMPDARAALKSNAAVLKAVLREAPSVQVRVEGHCDERGTLEYNLALGQRRANALRDYYTSLGIPKKLISTISYGEEKPACSEASENCWWKNRRGETTVKSAAGPVKIPADKLSLAN